MPKWELIGEPEIEAQLSGHLGALIAGFGDERLLNPAREWCTVLSHGSVRSLWFPGVWENPGISRPKN